MAEVLVLGGGIVGLTAGSLLARDGHQVTILERDPIPPPTTVDDLWAEWERKGVTQFHQAHYFQPRMTLELDRELPEVLARAQELGAPRRNVITMGGPLNGSVWQPGDEIFDIVTGRRPVIEGAFAHVAEATPGVTVRRGVAVVGLVPGPSSDDGVAHVAGVVTDTGEEITADLVIDAGGRRSALARWLDAMGAPTPTEEREDFGFTYYGRYFGADAVPDMAAPLLSTFGSVSILTLPADNNTWATAIIAAAGDAPLRKLLDPETFQRTLAAFPRHAHWGEGKPLTDDVKTMANLVDRRLSYVVDGVPVATGVLAIGDAWACSNPSLGRGATIAVLHAIALRDTFREVDGSDPVAVALAFDAATTERIQPWYDATLGIDGERKREIDSAIAGEPFEPGGPEKEIAAAFQHVATFDPATYRQFQKIAGMLAQPAEVISAPGVLDRVLEVGLDWRDHPVPGPDRAELLDLLAR